MVRESSARKKVASVHIPNVASHAAWMAAFQSIYRELPNPVEQLCPNCKNASLRLIFVGRPNESGIASAYFWCDTCLNGLGWSRVRIPDGIEVLPADMANSEIAKIIPDYWMVHGP